VPKVQGDVDSHFVYWIQTADLYPDACLDDTAFMAFDPTVRFPTFQPTEGDETIGNVHCIKLGEEEGMWQRAMTVSPWSGLHFPDRRR
jgi:hypothetical protein